MTLCDNCSNTAWCARHGCTTWNDYSRWLLDEKRRSAKRDNDLIDDIESDYISNNGRL